MLAYGLQWTISTDFSVDGLAQGLSFYYSLRHKYTDADRQTKTTTLPHALANYR